MHKTRKSFSSQQNAYIWRKHINFYASQTRIASFVIHENEESQPASSRENIASILRRRREKNPQRNMFIEKHSLAGLPSKKNNYLIVYSSLRSSPSHSRGLKVVNAADRKSKTSSFHKIFIELGFCLCELKDSSQSLSGNITRTWEGFYSSIGLFGRVILPQQIKQ